MKEKLTASFEIEADQQAWLDQITASHNLADSSKALRILLDFAMTAGDEAVIFDQIRCSRC